MEERLANPGSASPTPGDHPDDSSIEGRLLNVSCLLGDAKERIRQLIGGDMSERASDVAKHAIRNLEKADHLLEIIRDESRSAAQAGATPIAVTTPARMPG
jgi:hypothetical protein